jgi:hypothetical protein
MKIDICKFTQSKEDSIPQAWGGIVIWLGKVLCMVWKIMNYLIFFIMD